MPQVNYSLPILSTLQETSVYRNAHTLDGMDEAAKRALGRRLTLAMNEAQMTAPVLAPRIGKTKPAVYKWIKGQAVPGLDATLDMCRVLRVRLDWLATGRGTMTSAEPLSEAESGLLSVFRDMPPSAQESAAQMLKLGRMLYFDGAEERREAFQQSIAVKDPAE